MPTGGHSFAPPGTPGEVTPDKQLTSDLTADLITDLTTDLTTDLSTDPQLTP